MVCWKSTSREMIATRHNARDGWKGNTKRGVRLMRAKWVYSLPSHPCKILELWIVLPATYCGRRYLQPTTATNVAAWGYYQYEYRRYGQLNQAAAATTSSTSACESVLRSAVLRGGCDNDSILRLTRED